MELTPVCGPSSLPLPAPSPLPLTLYLVRWTTGDNVIHDNSFPQELDYGANPDLQGLTYQQVLPSSPLSLSLPPSPPPPLFSSSSLFHSLLIHGQCMVKMVNYGATLGLKFILESHTNEDCCGQQPNGLWYGKKREEKEREKREGGNKGEREERREKRSNKEYRYDVGGASDGTDGSGNVGTISDPTFLAVWQTRANLFKGNSAVSFDIFYLFFNST
jgi:hypothetical protein